MPTTRIRDALATVMSGTDLDVDTARGVMDDVMEGLATDAQIGALLAALRTKGESVSELTGFVESLRGHATTVRLAVDAVDTCGTGGDGLDTFNISTAAAIVVAGAGCPVAKHGNRSFSSRCGSADVLEALGVTISLPPDGVRQCVHEAGIGFMFAPLFHPALKHAANARRELGVRTVFNVLGPLANPARVRRQVLGVPDTILAAKMAEVLHRLDHDHALVVTGADGMDELGVDGEAVIHEVTASGVTRRTFDPRELGFRAAPAGALRGDDAAANALRIREVLGGDDGPARDVVLLNAAAALVVGGLAADFAEGLERARDSVDSGGASSTLERLVRVSAGYAS
jgi:anthranilate phosphoribosyltransferase